MAVLEVLDILKRVYGARGLAFPGKPNTEAPTLVAPEFEKSPKVSPARSRKGTPLYAQNALGAWMFLPARLNDIELQNPLVSIHGEKAIEETDIVGVGTVFEKVFTRPYDITIICTLINDDDVWPEDQIIQMKELWQIDDVLTLECAVTDMFLQPRNNFILKTFDLLDMQGVENSQVIQLSGRSNIDFELELK